MTPDPVPPARRDEGEMPRWAHERIWLQDAHGGPITWAQDDATGDGVEYVRVDLIAARESAAFARGRAEGIEEAEKVAEQRVRDLEAAERHCRAEVVRLGLSVTHEGPDATKRIMDRAIAARNHKPEGGCYCDECSVSAMRGTGEGNRG